MERFSSTSSRGSALLYICCRVYNLNILIGPVCTFHIPHATFYFPHSAHFNHQKVTTRIGRKLSAQSGTTTCTPVHPPECGAQRGGSPRRPSARRPPVYPPPPTAPSIYADACANTACWNVWPQVLLVVQAHGGGRIQCHCWTGVPRHIACVCPCLGYVRARSLFLQPQVRLHHPPPSPTTVCSLSLTDCTIL